MWRGLSTSYKRQIATTLPILRDGISLNDVLAEIELAVQQFWRDANEQCDLLDVSIEGQTLLLTWKKYPSKGRPRDNAIRSYIKTLVAIYERSTVARIGRVIITESHSAAQEKRQGRNLRRGAEEKYHPFLLVCIKAAGLAKGPKSYWGYPRGVVKEVLHESHPNAKRGRPPRH